MRITDNKAAKEAFFIKKRPIINLVSVVNLTDRLVGCITPGVPFELEGIDVFCSVKAGAASLNALICGDDAIVKAGALAIDAVPEKFQVALSRYRVGGVYVEKAAETAILFSAAHPVTASKFGVILVQTTNAGVISTKIPGATQTTAQAYNSAPLALAALPAADAGKLAIGYIPIAAKAALWTANTDDLTNGSDLTTAGFVTLAAGDRALNAAIDWTGGKRVPAVRHATPSRYKGSRTDSLLLLLTTDGTGALTNGSIEPSYRFSGSAGDGSHE